MGTCNVNAFRHGRRNERNKIKNHNIRSLSQYTEESKNNMNDIIRNNASIVTERTKKENNENNINNSNQDNLNEKKNLQVLDEQMPRKEIITLEEEKKLKELEYKKIFSFNYKKKTVILPKFFRETSKNIEEQTKKSNESDWNQLLKNISSLTKSKISQYILQLKERLWFKENIILSSLIESIRDNNDSLYLKKYIKNRISLVEHFNWLCWALSYLYQFKYNTNFEIFKLPQPDSLEWINGFEWEGVYIKILIEGREIKKVKRELKALSILFIEYIQMLDNCKIDTNNTLLSNQLVFPLISIGEFEGKCLMCSMCLKKDKDTFVVEDDDLKDYSYDDLNKSAIFRNLTKNNLIKIGKDENKFIIINAFDMIPNLYEYNDDIKNEDIGIIHCTQSEEMGNIIKYTTFSELIQNNDFLNKELEEEYESNFYDLKYKIIKCILNKEDEYINTFVNENFIQFSTNLIANKEDINSIEKEKRELNKTLNKRIFKANELNHKGDALIMYNFKGSIIKVKYPLINPEKKYDEAFVIKINYYKYIEQFIRMLKDISNSINDISLLNYYFEKYGINKSIKLFIVSRIDTENNITQLIKVDILTNIISQYIQESYSLNYLINIYQSERRENQKTTIKSLLNESILAIFSPKSLPIQNLENFYKKISNILYLYLLKFNRISHSLFNTHSPYMIYNPKILLDNLITTSRAKGIWFINQLETKLNVIIDPIAKFKLSISNYNFLSYYNINHITSNDPKVSSYISGNVISFYFLAKNINISNRTIEYEREKEKINNTNTEKEFDNVSKMSNMTNYENVNRSVVPNNFNILSSSHEFSRIKPKSEADLNNFTKINDNNGILELEYEQDTSEINNNDINLHNEIKVPQKINSNKINNNTNGQKRKIWSILKNYFSFKFPSLLYKIKFQESKSSQIYIHLNNEYNILQSETISNWSLSIVMIFSDIISVNLQTCYTMMYMYLFMFINYFFIEFNLKKARENFIKIEEIIQTNLIYFDCNWIIVLNLLQGALYEKIDFFRSESFFSKSLVFALFTYGDPRGRNNTASDIMIYPSWKIGRHIVILNTNSLINEIFKEFFHSIDFLYKKKLRYNREIKNFNPLYTKELSKACFYRKPMKFYNNEDYCNCDIDLNERPSLYISDPNSLINESNFNGDLKTLKQFQFMFPSISDTKSSYSNFFTEEKFVIFLLKQLSQLFNKHTVYYTKEYLSQLNLLKYQKNDKQNMQKVSSKSNLKKTSKFSPCLNEYLLDKLNFKNNYQNNILISWGINTHNETSHNNYSSLSIPRFVFKLKDKKIIKASCGLDHNLVLTNEGNVYSWGNNMSGQCGHKEAQTIYDPIEINELHNKNIIDITCGNEHSLCISKLGEVYAWGNSEDGVLGINGKKIEHTPIKIPLFDNNKIKLNKIVAGSIHNLALNDNEKVYSWGSAKGGELGLGEECASSKNADGFIQEPTLIPTFNDKNIIQISCGEAHSIALDNEGKVYTWGFGFNGQLGLGFCEDSFPPEHGKVLSRRTAPIALEEFDMKIKDIQCGKTFSMFINENDELYACGINDVHQLGIENFEPHIKDNTSFLNLKCVHCVKPTKIELFLNMKVIKIACGESHCIAIIEDKTSNRKMLWSWGSNKFGQLGQGMQNRKCLPKPINYFLQFNNADIFDIACGDFHSVCLMRNFNSNEFEEEETERKLRDIIFKYTSIFE